MTSPLTPLVMPPRRLSSNSAGPLLYPHASSESLWREPPAKNHGHFEKGSREELLLDLNDLLHRHCKQLGDFVDGRLEAYHKDVLQSLAGDRISRSGLQQSSSSRDAPAHSGVPLRLAEPAGEADEASPAGTDVCAPEEVVPPASCSTTPHHRGTSENERAALVEGADSEYDKRTGTVSSRADPIAEKIDAPLETFDQSERMKMARGYAVQAVQGPQESKSHATLPSFDHMRTWRGALQLWVRAPWFESAVCLLIISNVCFFGVEVQSQIENPGRTQLPLEHKVTEYLYTTFFTLELLVRLVACGPQKFFLGGGKVWNIIDFALVCTSLLEVCMEVAQEDAHNFGYARVIRMARTVRIFRVVRIMKFFRPLRILVYSIYNTLRSLFWVFVLLSIIIYSFGVIFTMASSQAMAAETMPEERFVKDHFGSLWISIYSLFKSISGGMDWQYAASAANIVHPAWGALFVVYIAFSHFAVLNVVTGVVCQTAIESAQQDQDIVVQSQLCAKQKYVEQFKCLFQNIDQDRSGKITLEEFEERLNDPTLRAYFEAMDLTTREAWSLFKLLDVKGTCLIDAEEFVAGCLNLRGNARSVDVHMLMYESKWIMAKLADIMHFVSSLKETQEQGLRHLSGTMSAEVQRLQGASEDGHGNLRDMLPAVVSKATL